MPEEPEEPRRRSPMKAVKVMEKKDGTETRLSGRKVPGLARGADSPLID